MSHLTEPDSARESPERTDTVARIVTGLEPGAHLCLFYEDDPEEQAAVMAPFLKAGLDAGERVIYVSDDGTPDDIRRWLERSGVDTRERIETGALLLWTREHWRQPGELNSDSKAGQVRQAITEAQQLGFEGIRFGVEMTWTLNPGIPAGPLGHWESTINTLFTPEFPSRIVCQYSRKQLSAAVLRAALVSHPAVIVGNELCWNPYYEAPLVLRDAPEDDRVSWMISQIQVASASAAEREQRVRVEVQLAASADSAATVETLRQDSARIAETLALATDAKEELLTLVSHELRTPLTVIAGMTTYLERNVDGGVELRQEATKEIVTATRRMARAVENMLMLSHFEHDAAAMEPILAQEILNEALATHSSYFPSAIVDQIGGGRREIVLAVRPWSVLALTNLLHNAEQYGDGREPTRVELVAHEDEVQFRVCNSGVVFNEGEYQALFEPFFRRPSVKDSTPGAGLGLTTALRLAEVQGGHLLAGKRPDKRGSMFTLALPAYTGDLTER